jgi:ribosomal-protein-alanine N-acetyltransferase
MRWRADDVLEVATGNTAAQALYARAGFTDVGLRRRYYADGSDALVMRVNLL